jgi:hypothetical protein
VGGRRLGKSGRRGRATWVPKPREARGIATEKGSKETDRVEARHPCWRGLFAAAVLNE